MYIHTHTPKSTRSDNRDITQISLENTKANTIWETQVQLHSHLRKPLLLYSQTHPHCQVVADLKICDKNCVGLSYLHIQMKAQIGGSYLNES